MSICTDLEYIKPKRAYGGIQGLKPFPRTGRSDPDLSNWDNAINAFDEDYEGNILIKRHNIKNNLNAGIKKREENFIYFVFYGYTRMYAANLFLFSP